MEQDRFGAENLLSLLMINKSWLLQSIWNVLEKERPGLLLLAFFAAQLIATPIVVYANWDWGGVIWLYSIVIYVPLDIFKFIIRYALSGKALWTNTLSRKGVVKLSTQKGTIDGPRMERRKLKGTVW
ncbi:hypothetical protein Tco_0373859 [Tanacetum coccineum]